MFFAISEQSQKPTILAISAEKNRLKFAIEEGLHWDESSENKSVKKSVLEGKMNWN